MSSRTDTDLVGDIREAIQRIAAYSAGMSYADFAADGKDELLERRVGLSAR